MIRISDFSVQRSFVNDKGESPLIDRIEFSPDGKHIALASGKTVDLCDVSDITAHAKGSSKY
ncbi:MAG: hypothetical protein C4527_07470 [Candidatus Omnitrophota bacterium]|jgi:translation elongation factor P/translation initiation factor 5A|nr:MAG: hypothetical protein C4527_07470 [Candidatus Omnitrophota bacterium]